MPDRALRALFAPDGVTIEHPLLLGPLFVVQQSGLIVVEALDFGLHVR